MIVMYGFVSLNQRTSVHVLHNLGVPVLHFVVEESASGDKARRVDGMGRKDVDSSVARDCRHHRCRVDGAASAEGQSGLERQPGQLVQRGQEGADEMTSAGFEPAPFGLP